MKSEKIQINRTGAEIFNGESIGNKKCVELLEEINLPKGLLQLENMTEFGYNRTTGFVWMKQKAKTQHKFKSIGRNVYYDIEITAVVENKRMRQVTGIKTKELLIYPTICDIYIDDKDFSKIIFGTPRGITRSFAASAFELDQ